MKEYWKTWWEYGCMGWVCIFITFIFVFGMVRSCQYVRGREATKKEIIQDSIITNQLQREVFDNFKELDYAVVYVNGRAITVKDWNNKNKEL